MTISDSESLSHTHSFFLQNNIQDLTLTIQMIAHTFRALFFIQTLYQKKKKIRGKKSDFEMIK